MISRSLLGVSSALLLTALAGCAPVSVEELQETAPASEPSVSSAEDWQPWADSVMEPYLRQNPDLSRMTTPNAPHRQILGWGALAHGELQVIVSGERWQNGADLDAVATGILADLEGNRSVISVEVWTIARDAQGKASGADAQSTA
ncbi:hypothetical protein GCM10027417_14880 [Glutamicibacter endophyticus]